MEKKIFFWYQRGGKDDLEKVNNFGIKSYDGGGTNNMICNLLS